LNGRRAGRAATAIFGQKSEKRVHLVELSGVDHRPAFTPHGDETSHPQAIKMERERVGRKVERGGHGPGRHPISSGLHKQPKHIKPIVLGERSQGGNSIRLFHISRIVEIIGAVKKYFDNN
jgi:hypothetical protein